MIEGFASGSCTLRSTCPDVAPNDEPTSTDVLSVAHQQEKEVGVPCQACGKRCEKRVETLLRSKYAHRSNDHRTCRHDVAPTRHRRALKAFRIETVVAEMNLPERHPLVGGEVLTQCFAIDDNTVGQPVGHFQTDSNGARPGR
jgi:hypothetical protein